MKAPFAAFPAIGSACSLPADAQWIEVNGHTTGYVSAVAVNGKSLFEGTRHCVYLFSDNGTGWKTVNLGLPNMSVQTITVTPNGTGGTNLFAGTYGGGVWRRPLSEMVTGVKDAARNSNPGRFELAQS